MDQSKDQEDRLMLTRGKCEKTLAACFICAPEWANAAGQDCQQTDLLDPECLSRRPSGLGSSKVLGERTRAEGTVPVAIAGA